MAVICKGDQVIRAAEDGLDEEAEEGDDRGGVTFHFWLATPIIFLLVEPDN